MNKSEIAEKHSELGKKIAAARNKKRWTIYRLAKVSGLVCPNLIGLENGRGCNTTTLLKLEKALGITLLNRGW